MYYGLYLADTALTEKETRRRYFENSTDEWIAMRKQTIMMIRRTAGKIDWHYKNTNITRIFGATTAIAGGFMTMGGSIVLLATAGLAAPIAGPVVAAGVALSVTGGGASAGASIADVVISKLKLSDIQRHIDADNEKLKKLIQHQNEACSSHGNHLYENNEFIEATFSVASSVGRAGSGAAAITYTGGRAVAMVAAAGKDVVQVGKVGGGIAKGGAAAMRLGSVALQGAAVAGIAIEFIVIPLNVAEIIMSGVSLYKGSETKASRQLREKANEYQEQMEFVSKMISGH